MFIAQDNSSILVCVDSMSSSDIFIENRKGDFICQLAESIINSTGEKIYVRPASVAISRKFIHPHEGVSHLKLHLTELEGQPSGRKFSNTLATFAVDATRDEYFLHTFTNVPYLPLRFQQLQALHVKLTDQDEEDVFFADSPPTILWLEMTSQPKNSDQFLVHNVSYQPGLYPGNTHAAFTSPLPDAMDLKGHEVALFQLVYPPFLTEYPDDVTLRVNEEVFRYDLSRIRTTPDFIRQVWRDVINSQYGDELYVNLRPDPDYCIQFERIRLDPAVKVQGRLTIEPSGNFTRACGQLHKPQNLTELQPGESFNFDGSPSIHLAKPNPFAMLHCSIVKPNIVGRKQARLLQSVPVMHDKPATSKRIYEPQQLVFQPVQDMPFDSIDFSFHEVDGRLKNMHSTLLQHAVVITLVFRKIK